MLLDSLVSKRVQIQALAHQFGAKRIRVFGSVARREERDDSDIDFLVDLPMGYDLFRQRIPLADALSDLTGRVIDLVPEHEINKHLRAYILSEATDL